MKRATFWLALSVVVCLGILLNLGGSPATRITARSARMTDNMTKFPAASRQAATVSAMARQPLRFEANQGQADGRVQFVSRGAGYTLFLSGASAVLELRHGPAPQNPRVANERAGASRKADSDAASAPQPASVLAMQLEGANPNPPATGEDLLAGRSNYFIGGNAAKWRTGAANYAKVRYHGVYPGVDLVYYGHQGSLEYDFDVAPGANPGQIRLKLSGAQQTGLARNGDLLVRIAGGRVVLHKPAVYQAKEGKTVPVEGGFTLLAKNEAGFRVGAYDHNLPLVVDPALGFSTFLGGSERELMFGLGIDPSDSVYVCGTTYSTDFPTTVNAFQLMNGGDEDAFVSKYTADGSTLVYSTYLGGAGRDICDDLAVDAVGDVFITGQTASRDFPVTAGAFQIKIGGTTSAFVTKLNPAGSALVYSTYIGGDNASYGYGMTIDAVGDAFITGFTRSTNFPTLNAVQSNPGGAQDAFLTEMNATGTGLVFSTYLGGSRADIGYKVALDATGAAIVTGRTDSLDFPVSNAFQSSLRGISNAFLAKFAPGGGAVDFSTYLGGSVVDFGTGVGVDAAGNIYVGGMTRSPDFPLMNARDSILGGGRDAFVTSFTSDGQALNYSSYLGGGNGDFGEAVAVDAAGNVFIVGCTTSRNFPLRFPIQNHFAGGNPSGDAFITEVAPTGTLRFSTYLGGSDNDAAYAVAVDPQDNIFVSGRTASTDFPTEFALQQNYAGMGDDWVARISFNPVILSSASVSFGTVAGGNCASKTLGVRNAGAGPVTLTFVISGTNKRDFTVNNQCPSNIMPGASCTATLNFCPLPGDSGPLSATLNVSNSTGGAQTVAMSGTGT